MQKFEIGGIVPAKVAETLLDLSDYMGIKFTVTPCFEDEKVKEKTLENIYAKIMSRFEKSKFTVHESFESCLSRFTTVRHPKKGIGSGCARCNPKDTYDYDIGYYLALVRSCGWKDLEEELLSIL